MMTRRIITLVTLSFALFTPGYAQTTVGEPLDEKSKVDNVEQTESQGNVTDKQSRSSNDKLFNKPEAVEESHPTDTEKARFDILEFRVMGNTLLSIKLLESSVYNYLGRQKTLEDIEKARNSLEQTYKNSGYPAVVVSIPEQKIKNGIVKLQVVEGKISRVRISGSQYHSLSEIKQRVPALSRGNVLYLPDVQQQLNALNQASPDRAVTPVLKPGRDPGTVEVELKVKDELPLHGGLEVNNRHSSNTTPTRASASLRYDNLFQKQHSIGMQYQASPEKTEEVKVLALTYIMPASEENDRLVFYGIDSNSNVSTLGDLTVLGNGKIFGTRWVKPLTGTQSYFHSISPGFDYKDFEDTQQVAGADLLFPISYWMTTLRYDSSLVSISDVYQYNAAIVFGLPFNSKQDEFTAKRAGSKNNFLYFTGGISYKYTFENDIQIKTRADAQLATSPLISNEQFSAGGGNSVRGYYESQIVNDSGATASIELVSPRIYESVKDIKDFRAHIFYDGSRTWRKDPLPSEPNITEIAASGLGFRFHAFEEFLAELDVAWALKDEGDVKKNDVRWHFKIAYEF